MQRRRRASAHTKGMTRREFLTWLVSLSGLAASGACSVGVLMAFLARRYEHSVLQVSPTPLPTHDLTPTAPPLPPEVIPRAEWNALPPNHMAEDEFGFASAENPTGWHVYSGDLATIYTTAVIHHSFPLLRDSGTMRALQDLHMQTRRWADIGYHFGIDGAGRVYEGRDIRVRGASVAGYNTGTLGIVLMGNFEVESPSGAQLFALQRLLHWLKQTYTLTHLAGHYEFNPTTACPGKNMRPYLSLLAESLRLQRGTGGYVPPKVQSKRRDQACC
ncbi:MAG: peptidoglycan recognition family protein [Anaerolineae bacterium]|nr:peptidoglycan recognition protein family protein [Anaerolineae bacterium]MDW8298066.1 peptidoglycan recognition family protein [Anaerolineae bacterium]